MVSGLFDDHYEALVLWREAGLKGLTCVHIDAHLDVMARDFTRATLDGIAAARNGRELEEYRGNTSLPWGGLHCGNYLYPALVDGTVEELIWVVPRFVIGGDTFLDGARQETQSWVDLSFREYKGLKSVEGRAEGTLAGRKFVICTADTFPTLTEKQLQNLALDIDVDYFVRCSTDELWQTPHELREKLPDMQPRALTIAYSVDGGYTPLQQRYLGEVTRDVFSGNPQAWKSEVQKIRELDQLEDEEKRPGLEEMLEVAPDWLKPALFLRLERAEEAAEANPAYKPKPLNAVARFMLQKRYKEALEAVEDCSSESAERRYLESFIAYHAGEYDRARQCLVTLRESGQVSPGEQFRVVLTQAECCNALGEHKKALELLKEAESLEPGNPQVPYQQYQAHKGMGDRKKAGRSLRKALRKADGKVSSLEMLVEAARLYDEMGQAALAKSTRRQIKEMDVTGHHTVRTMLDEAKL